jgi:hypothetical protein
MKLQSPCFITSRLRAGIKCGSLTISIAFNDKELDGRVNYRYWIDSDDGRDFYSEDLSSGIDGGSLQDGLESLLSFMGAAAESYSYALRRDRVEALETSFPTWLAELCYVNSDELQMAQCELEETPNAID